MKQYFVLKNVDFEDKLRSEVYFVLEMAVFKDKHLRRFVQRQQRAWEAIERMRASAAANDIADMSMEEIDEEIRLARRGE